jgi:ubiquitin C-terminal hydrolase
MMRALAACRLQLREAGGSARYDPRSRETTFIHRVFAGYTRNQVECRACGHISRTYECCSSLTLEVSPRIASLEAALRSFTAVERLDGANRWVAGRGGCCCGRKKAVP